jgi:hypothetical protein
LLMGRFIPIIEVVGKWTVSPLLYFTISIVSNKCQFLCPLLKSECVNWRLPTHVD